MLVVGRDRLFCAATNSSLDYAWRQHQQTPGHQRTRADRRKVIQLKYVALTTTMMMNKTRPQLNSNETVTQDCVRNATISSWRASRVDASCVELSLVVLSWVAWTSRNMKSTFDDILLKLLWIFACVDAQANFVRPLLSHDPELRPSAKEILQHPIVKDFEDASQAYQRLHSQSRYRTMSNSSGNSSSTADSSSLNAPVWWSTPVQ